ncbi:MAG: hypothetical protein LBQ57_09940 [Spirochaetales bacterium]|jgi:hypothetical protein|nr:hypothetical protein [Spirochaetales bacterium]
MPFYALKKHILFRFFLVAQAALLPVFSYADAGVSRPQRYVADGAVTSLYVDNDGSMICVSGGSSILRVGRDLQTLWNRSLSGKPALVFRRKDGVIMIATVKGRLEAYNSQAQRVADFALPVKQTSGREDPAADLLTMGETEEGWIFLFTADGGCAVFNLWGDILSLWQTPQTPSCPPVLFQGKLVCASADGSLDFFSPSGRPAGKAPAAASVLRLVVNPFTQTLAVARLGGAFELYPATLSGPPETAAAGLTGGQTGEDIPEVEPFLRLSIPFEIARILPLVSGGFVLVGKDGRVLTLNSEGEAAGDFFLKEANPIGVSTDGSGALFFTDSRGRLSSYSPGGSSLWTANLAGKPGIPVLSPSARYLAVGSEDWVIERFEFVQYGGRQASRAASPSPADTLAVTPAQSAYRGEYDFIYLMDRASAATADKKTECLDIIEERMKRGLGRSLDYIPEVLRYVAAEPHILHGAKNYLGIQSRALALLGRIQHRDYRDFLSSFLAREKDASLLLAVLSAMEAMRSDPDEVLRRGIYGFILSRVNNLQDTRLSAALVNALDGISLYHGSLGVYGRAALMQLLENSSPAARLRIQNLLKTRP